MMTDRIQEYDVVWTTPSNDASGSMPLGNGDVAANVWVDERGDLLLLLAKSDAWDENSTLLKLGRLRVSITPNPLVAGASFRQVLRLSQGEITIDFGESDVDRVTMNVWADATAPMIHVEVDAKRPVDVRVELEQWRREPYTIKTQTGDLFKNLNGPDPYPTVVTPDVVLTEDANALVWYHRNETRDPDPYEVNLKLQGLGGMLQQQPHPLRDRVFGGCVAGDGMTRESATSLRSDAPRASRRLRVTMLTQHPSTVEAWASVIRKMASQVRADARAMHRHWWADFWRRSHVFLASTNKRVAEETRVVTRGYVLQRYMNACAGRGAQPIKYNGSLFSYGTPTDPDFRRWGGPGFWFQNQRLIYWPMFADGDFDLLRSFALMYRDQLSLQQHRTATYYGHAGAHYPETITFWGAEVSGHYGWTPFEQRKTPEAECSYVTHYYTCGIELTLMLHEWFSYTQDGSIVREYLAPIANAVMAFYDEHYARDAGGKIRFEPAQALETWQDATNPLPEIAGLRYVLPRLLSLPEHLTAESQRARWSRMLRQLPPIPTGELNGVPVVLPAERFDKLKNTENPELYCVFPFRLFGMGKPDLQLAWNTFAARRHVEHTCWHQDDLQAALLGLTGTAAANVVRRAGDASHSDSRFPAFWNAHHDWIPDIDHGGVLQLTVQAMLMQCEGRRILLLPAWPERWDADFKLHAPFQTTIEGSVRAGRLIELSVTPPERSVDVELCAPFKR